MARNIYKNRLNELKELRQARSNEMFAKTIKQMATQVNQRFYRLEKAGLAKDTAYRYAKQETGKEKPRYTTNLNKLENMSLEELFQLGVQLNQKLVSKTSTITGQAELEEKRVSMAIEELGKAGVKDIDKNSFKNFLNSGGAELLNSKYLDSTQIIEDWNEYTRSGAISSKEFIEAFNKSKEKNKFDYGDVIRRLDNLLDERS